MARWSQNHLWDSQVEKRSCLSCSRQGVCQSASLFPSPTSRHEHRLGIFLILLINVNNLAYSSCAFFKWHTLWGWRACLTNYLKLLPSWQHKSLMSKPQPLVCLVRFFFLFNIIYMAYLCDYYSLSHSSTS